MSLFAVDGLYGQTCTNTQTGTPCNRSATFADEYIPDQGCGVDRAITNFSPGTYFRIPGLEGACYTVSTCGNTIDTQVGAFQGINTTIPFAYNDNDGPDCSGNQASMVVVPTFTDYIRVDVRESNCSAGGSASITVNIRQNNNLAFTSAATDMLQGDTRALTAIPAAVTFSQANSGDEGSFSGIGVAGTTFTAPTPQGASETFTITYAFGYCTTTQDITVFAQPTAFAGPDQEVCDSSTSLFATSPNFGTGEWSIVSGPGVLSDSTDPTSNLTGLVNGNTTTLVWTVTNGPGTATDTLVVISSELPTTPNAGPDVSICDVDTFQLSGNALGTSEGEWVVLNGSGTFSDSSSNTATVSNLGLGSNLLIWTSTLNNACGFLSDTVSIERFVSDTIVEAGADTTICSSTYNLNASFPDFGSGTWSLVSGQGNIANPNSATSAVTGLGAGNNIFVWTVTNGNCPVQTDTVTISRDPEPQNINAGIDQTVCSDSTNMAASTPLIGTGTWSLLSGQGNIINPASEVTGITNLGIGDNVFLWTVSNGICSAETDTVTITRDQEPSPADAGPDQSVCDTSAVLGGTVPIIGDGEWSLLSGAGTFTDSSDASTTVNGLAIGNNTLLWTVTNGSCPSETDTVIITRNEEPSLAATGPDQTICEDSLALNAIPPIVGTGEWTLLSGSGTFADSSSATTTVSGIGIGTNEYVWTTSNGVCPSSSDTLVITRDQEPSAADAGPDQSICGTSTILGATAALIGDGEWTLLSGAGTFADSSDANTAVSGLAVGNNIFLWTVSNGTCPPNTDTVIIERDSLPGAAFAGSDQIVCSDSAMLDADSANVGSGMWMVLSGTATFADPNDPETSVALQGNGTYEFVWTVSNGSCPTSSDTVTVSYPLVASPGPIMGDSAICTGDSAMLMVANPAGASLAWYDAATGGNLLSTDSFLVTMALTMDMTYYVEAIDSATGCISMRDSFTVMVNALPDPMLPDSVFGCDGDLICLSVDSSYVSVLWSNGAIGPVTCVNMGGIYIVEVTDSNGCTGSDTVQVIFDALPQFDLGPDTTICFGDVYTIGVSDDSSSSYLWSTGDTTSTIEPQISNLYSLTVTDSNGCSATDSVSILILSPPTANFMFDTTNCPVVQFTDMSMDADDYLWDFGDGSGTSTAVNPGYDYSLAGNNGTYTVTLQVSNQCGIDTVSMDVDINCLVGVTPELQVLTLTAYPNPSDGRFKVRLPEISEPGMLEVVDLTGRRIYAAELTVDDSRQELPVVLENASAGVVLVRVYDGHRYHIARLVID